MTTVVCMLILTSLVMRKQKVPLDPMIKSVRDVWLTGVCPDLTLTSDAPRERDEFWLQESLLAARRKEPLADDVMELICSQMWMAKAALTGRQADIAALRMRIYFVCAFVVFVRLTMTVDPTLVLIDVGAQGVGALISISAVYVTSRALREHWFWQSELTDDGKAWIMGLLLDQHAHPEFASLKQAERVSGRSLRSVRRRWLSVQAASFAVSERLQTSRTTLLIMMFDLLALGPILLGGTGAIVASYLLRHG